MGTLLVGGKHRFPSAWAEAAFLGLLVLVNLLLSPVCHLHYFCLLLPLLFAACGDLPEPFLGNPGENGRRLAQPPTPRLAVPPPANALLPSDGAIRIPIRRPQR